MTLVDTRVGLQHRCTIERDANASTEDSWGHSLPPDWEMHLQDVPCRAWVNSGREPVDSDRTIVVIDARVIVPLGTDVTERDRVATITVRGAELFEGPMGIEAVTRHREHLELSLQRIR